MSCQKIKLSTLDITDKKEYIEKTNRVKALLEQGADGQIVSLSKNWSNKPSLTKDEIIISKERTFYLSLGVPLLVALIEKRSIINRDIKLHFDTRLNSQLYNIGRFKTGKIEFYTVEDTSLIDKEELRKMLINFLIV